MSGLPLRICSSLGTSTLNGYILLLGIGERQLLQLRSGLLRLSHGGATIAGFLAHHPAPAMQADMLTDATALGESGN